MATKKQQRRREKERRHEYEEVWVDAEGNEIEAPPERATSRPAARGKDKPKGTAQPRSRRPMREVKPPSWRRVAPRAVILGVLMFVVLGLGKKHSALGLRVGLTALYTGLFVPTFYWIDRFAYRRYQRMTGGGAPTKK